MNVSASTPPMYASNTSGSISVVWTSATRSEACGWLTNSHWAPTVCIQEPMLLTRTASQSARKIPTRSGAQVESALSAVRLNGKEDLTGGVA